MAAVALDSGRMGSDDSSYDGGAFPPVSSLLVAQLAVDLRQVLDVMVRGLEALRSQVPPNADIDQSLAEIDGAVDGAFYVARELLALTQPPSGQIQIIDLNELVLQARGVIERGLRTGVFLSLRLAADRPIVQADAIQLEWVLLNLALNAADAMADGGHVTIEIASVDVPLGAPRDGRGGQYVRVSVVDTGTGLTDEAWNRAFEPFFSTRAGRTGFGLTSVAMTVRRLRGWLAVHDNEPHGTRVDVYLPLLARDTAPVSQ